MQLMPILLRYDYNAYPANIKIIEIEWNYWFLFSKQHFFILNNLESDWRFADSCKNIKKCVWNQYWWECKLDWACLRSISGTLL